MRTPGSPPVHCQRRVGSHAVMRNVLRPSRLMCNAPDDDGPSGPSGVTSTLVMCGAHSGQRRTSPNRSQAVSSRDGYLERSANSDIIHTDDSIALSEIDATVEIGWSFRSVGVECARTRFGAFRRQASSSNSQICLDPRRRGDSDPITRRRLAATNRLEHFRVLGEQCAPLVRVDMQCRCFEPVGMVAKIFPCTRNDDFSKCGSSVVSGATTRTCGPSRASRHERYIAPGVSVPAQVNATDRLTPSSAMSRLRRLVWPIAVVLGRSTGVAPSGSGCRDSNPGPSVPQTPSRHTNPAYQVLPSSLTCTVLYRRCTPCHQLVPVEQDFVSNAVSKVFFLYDCFLSRFFCLLERDGGPDGTRHGTRSASGRVRPRWSSAERYRSCRASPESQPSRNLPLAIRAIRCAGRRGFVALRCPAGSWASPFPLNSRWRACCSCCRQATSHHPATRRKYCAAQRRAPPGLHFTPTGSCWATRARRY